MSNRKCKGFILLKEYPHSKKTIGAFEPFTTGEFLKYPEIWQPLYEYDVKELYKEMSEKMKSLEKQLDTYEIKKSELILEIEKLRQLLLTKA